MSWNLSVSRFLASADGALLSVLSLCFCLGLMRSIHHTAAKQVSFTSSAPDDLINNSAAIFQTADYGDTYCKVTLLGFHLSSLIMYYFSPATFFLKLIGLELID